MCAINPKFKKRIIIDVYVSEPICKAKGIETKEQFEDMVLRQMLDVELDLNGTTCLRWHVKETEQEAA